MSVRIKDLATTATSPAADDYIAIDGATNGTRKIPAGDIGGGGTSDDITNESTVSGANVTGALNTLSDQIANEQTARQSAVSAVQGAVTSEASTRADADASLRSAIDALVSPSGQSVVIDNSLSISGAAADAKVTGEIKSDLNNVKTGNNFTWELGTLTPGNGNPQPGTTRARSDFILVTTGTEITLQAPNSRLLVYSFDANKSYLADSPWLGSNKFTVGDVNNTPTKYVRLLVRKDTSNSSITSSELEDLVAPVSLKYKYPDNTITNIEQVSKLDSSLNGSRYLTDFEIGGMNGGLPYNDTAYIRTKNFIRVKAGDVLTVTPTEFGIYNGAIYKYTTNNASGYNASHAFSGISAGSVWRHIFTDDGWFKFRASNKSSGALINPEDIVKFDNIFYLEHLYDASEIANKIGAFGIDYDSVNASISNTFNLAIQTDTHMALNVAYTTTEYPASNFSDLESAVNAINKLDIDIFVNLGDFIRGYQADPEYESRDTADAMLATYKKIRTNKAFVVGNHDDGCLYYYDLTYNDKQSIYQVMYPNEQFNRYTKFGINNKGTKNYYYKDINGVRIITLYQRDFDYSASIPGIESFNIGAEQLEWFANTALNTTLPVIILTHAPLAESLYQTSRNGFDDVLSAISSFVSSGGTVIAALSGHNHAQNSAIVDGVNHIVFKNGYTFFELVSVNLTARTINCKAINNSSLQDRSFTY